MKLKNVVQHCNVLADKRDAGAMTALLNPITDTLTCRAFNAAGLAIGTSSKAKIKVVNNTLCSVDGITVLVAAGTEVAFTATTHDIADTYMNVYVVSVDSTGTCHIDMGVPALITATVTAVVLPELASGRAVLGLVSIATSGAIFDASTTELDAGTVTDLYYDVVGPWATK
jgi:hypothetical protein